MKHKDIFENRTTYGGGVAHNDCLDCNEELVFAMRDTHHEFSIGLRTILQCLRIAEQEGNVPVLPHTWWRDIAIRHGQHFLTEYQKE